jgi:hypothetical protein
MADGLIDPFFLMDKGSIGVGAGVKPFDVLGFGVSVFPVGKKGCRLLRGILETGFELWSELLNGERWRLNSDSKSSSVEDGMRWGR